MTAVAQPYALDLELPWTTDPKQDEAFKKNLKRIIIPLLLLFIAIPWLPVFEKEYVQPESEIVKTKIVLEPVVVEEPEVEPEKPKPKPKPKKKKQVIEKKAEKPAGKTDTVKEVKKKDVAEEQGLAGLSQQLSALRQSMDLTKLQKKNVTKSNSGKVTRSTKTVLGQDKLTQKSEGIVVDDSVMSDVSVALAMHESTKLDGFIDGGNPSADSSSFYSDLKGQRSDESIRRVFEAGKSKAYMYYLRALRENPGLAGTFVFEVVIEPNGQISDLRLVSSELNSPDLEQKILTSVRRLNFGAEDVSARKLKYKFNFLPS